MSEKEKILGRVREALKSPAPHPGHAQAHSQPASPLVASNNNCRQWLPVVGESLEDRIELFRKNAASLNADFYLVEGWKQASGALVKLREQEDWQRVGAHKGD